MTQQGSGPATTKVSLTRILDASRDTVFRAWTEADQLLEGMEEGWSQSLERLAGEVTKAGA
jgi:hypothetical protein